MPSLAFHVINGPGAGPGRSKRRKLRGAKKLAFVKQMAAGRRKAKRKNGRANVLAQMPAVKRPASSARRAHAGIMPRANVGTRIGPGHPEKHKSARTPAQKRRYHLAAVRAAATRKRNKAKRANGGVRGHSGTIRKVSRKPRSRAAQKAAWTRSQRLKSSSRGPSGRYTLKENPRKRATGAKRKKTMAKRRKKMSPAAKKAFVRRMARARRKKAGGGKVRRRRTHRKSRARRSAPRARRVVRRHRRGRKNPGGIETAPMSPTRRRRRKARKTGVARRRRSGAYRALTNKIHRLEAGLNRKGRKRAKRTSPARARVSALRLRRRAISPGVSAGARHYMKLHGLNKVNPSMSGFYAGLKAIPGVALEVGVFVGGTLALSAGSTWLGDQIVAKYGASYAKWTSPVLSLLVGVAGFLGLRMASSQAVRALSVPALAAGVGGAAINVLAENHVAADGTKPAMSWGRALMLPIGAVIYRGETANQSMQLGMGAVVQRRDTANQSMQLGMGAVIQRAETLNKPIRLGDLDRILAMSGIAGVDGVDGVNIRNDTDSGF